MMNDISKSLAFLKVGVKTKQKSYLLRGKRKIAFYSVIIALNLLGLFGLYKLFF